MPSRQDDNYQYDADTINSDGFDRYRLYEKGDDEWLEIIDKETGRSVQFKDGDIRTDAMNGIQIAREEDGDDIFDAVNKALAESGSDTTVFVSPGKFTRENGRAVSTQLETTNEGQIINFLGSDVELADGADINPVHIHHDSCSIKNLVVRANRDNNTLTAALHIHGVIDSALDNIEVANAPIGIWIDNASNASYSDIETNLTTDDVDTVIQFEGSDDSSLTSSNFSGFSDAAIKVIDSHDIIITATDITTDPDGQATANAALHVIGTEQSNFSLSIHGNGDLTDGVLVEPYDVGGTDERISSKNQYDVRVSKAQSVGVHLSDADNERVTGSINGNNITSQGFLVDFPNGLLDSPGHHIGLDVLKCDRISDTQISSNNAAMHISGSYKQISSTSTFQSNGTGILIPTFGPSMPAPAFNILTNTDTNAQMRSKRKQTDTNGQITVDWSDLFAFDDKPLLMIQLENAGSWYIDTYNTDANGRYISATVQITDPDGTAAGGSEPVVAVLKGV